ATFNYGPEAGPDEAAVLVALHGRTTWRSAGGCDLAGAHDDLVYDPVVLRLFGGEPAVAVEVDLDLLDGLACVVGDALGHHPLGVDDLLGGDGDVGGRALHLARRLMHQDPRVRQGEALARRPRAQQELAHRRRHPDTKRGHVAADVLHGVVDGEAGVDRAAR